MTRIKELESIRGRLSLSSDVDYDWEEHTPADIAILLSAHDLLVQKLRRWCPMNRASFEKMIEKIWTEAKAEAKR